MNNKKIEDWSGQEFRGILDYMASEEFDRMTAAEFFNVLAVMEEDASRQTIASRATVKERGAWTFTFMETEDSLISNKRRET